MDENELRVAIKKAKSKEPEKKLFRYDNSSRFSICELARLTGIKGYKIDAFRFGKSNLKKEEQEKVWYALEVLTRGMV